MRICDFFVLLLICEVQGEVDNNLRDKTRKQDLQIIDEILREKENKKFIHSIQKDEKVTDIEKDKRGAEIHEDAFKDIEMLHVTDRVEYEGNMGKTAKQYINDELGSIGNWLKSEKVEGKRRYKSCWVWCNDMKNWYQAAEQLLKVQKKWLDYINAFSGSCDVFKEAIEPDITTFKAKNTCWGLGCKDSTEYNRLYREMGRRLQMIVDSPYITDSPTSAPSAAPTLICKDYDSSYCESRDKERCTTSVKASYILCRRTCGLCTACMNEFEDDHCAMIKASDSKSSNCENQGIAVHCKKTCEICE
jgi:hypothetical protein